MKIGKSYTIDEEVIEELKKVAKEKNISSSWLANDFLKKGLKEMRDKQ